MPTTVFIVRAVVSEPLRDKFDAYSADPCRGRWLG
jgi:hypothetical protein